MLTLSYSLATEWLTSLKYTCIRKELIDANFIKKYWKADSVGWKLVVVQLGILLDH